VTNEAGLEKIANRQLHKREIVEKIKEQQTTKISPTNRSAEADADQQELDPVDVANSANPQYVVAYVREVYDHLRETEVLFYSKKEI